MRTILHTLIALGLCLAPMGGAVAQDDLAAAIEDVVFSELEKRLLREGLADIQTVPPLAPQFDDILEQAGALEAPVADEPSKKVKKGKKGKKGNKSAAAKAAGKSGELPPGLAKHLEKHGTLPPGLFKRSLPAALEARLPPPPEGTARVIVDHDVVLIERSTGLILDILEDVLGR